jgi:PAS domain S-box-containing protein
MMAGEGDIAIGLPPNGQEPLCSRPLIYSCAVLVAAVGLISLLGWALKLFFLASLGSGLIPVAPSTAVMFIAYAFTIFLCAHRPFRRWKYWTGISINAAGALIALLLAVLSYQGIRLKAEEMGFALPTGPAAAPVGHMSPVTAFCFLLSSLSYILALSSPDNRWRLASIAWWLACCIVAAGATLVLAYLYGTPILYGSSFIPPAAPTSIAFVALAAALLALAAPNAWPPLPDAESATRTSYAFLMVFILLAGGIVVSGFLYYRNWEKQQRSGVDHQLSSVADLKTAELEKWRSERVEDGEIIFRNETFSRLAMRYFRNPRDKEAKSQLWKWISEYPKNSEYDQVRLIDNRGVPLMSVPQERPVVSTSVSKAVADVLRSGRIEIVDFYRHDYDQRIYISVLIPLLDVAAGNRTVGVVSLRVDPRKYLYPFILRWPTPSKTAETLLVRREGNEVLFLNELRFLKNTTLSMRRSLGQKESPAVQAVMGRVGITEGKDYRGVPVIAYVRAVPGSPWFLVARMDVSEVYGPATEKLWMTIVLVMALVVGAGGGVGLVWRRQYTQFYKMKCETAANLQASEERYRRTIDNMIEGLQIIGADWRYLYINDSAAGHGRRTRNELLGHRIMEIYPGIETTEMFAALRTCMEQRTAHVMENEFVYPEGDKAWFELSIQPVPEGIVILSMDISERKKRERQIEQKNAELERFIYTISHDLKSPLVTVKTFLGYLREDLSATDTERIEKDMGYISAAAGKMGMLLDELLEMSRVGRMVNPPVAVSFRELVDEALNAVAGSIAERNVEVHVSDERITLYGDRMRLAEIWQNLLENAVKFMGDQTLPHVEIGVEHDDSATIFLVRDNGIGIDPRYKGKVFGLFDKLDPKSEGTGLGLALVKRIVELYKGKIWLESNGPGKGTCFYFTLPQAHIKPDKGERT